MHDQVLGRVQARSGLLQGGGIRRQGEDGGQGGGTLLGRGDALLLDERHHQRGQRYEEGEGDHGGHGERHSGQ